MKFNNFRFKNFAEFKELQKIATEAGYKTAEEFNAFLNLFCSRLKIAE